MAYAAIGFAWTWLSHTWSTAGSNGEASSNFDRGLIGSFGWVLVGSCALYFVLRRMGRRTEAAQKEAAAVKARYRALLDNSSDAIHLLDGEGRLIEANQAFYRSLGIDPESPPALVIADWETRWSPESFRSAVDHITNRRVTFESRHRRRDGGLFDVEISATAFDADGQKLLVCVARDLSTQRQLQRAQLRAERLESLGLLAGGVAHDLNNALSPIILGADLLRARHPATADDPLLASISSSAKRGATILRHLLTFARGVEGERRPVAVRPLLGSLAYLGGEKENLIVELDIAPELPPIVGDTAQLHQVLLSLVNNSREAMPSGGRLVLGARPRTLTREEAARLPGAHPGHFLELYVRDTGTGLSLQAREHLFEPFFTTKPRGHGTGLGLSTALGIVRSHGGTIEHVAPAEGGAEFRVLIPVAVPDQTPTPPTLNPTDGPGRRAPIISSAFDASLRGEGRSLLLVEAPGAEGSPSVLLERNGYQVRHAGGAHDALTRVANDPAPELLIIDAASIPESDTALLVKTLQARHPRIPHVILCARSGETGPRCPPAGAISHSTVLHKPIDGARLLAAVEKLLGTT